MQTYFIEGMDCADCVRTIERGVQKLEGVKSVEVNLATAQMVVVGQISEKSLRQRVEKLGYRLKDPRDAATTEKQSRFFAGFIH
jgi:copper chaperone CopZ